MTPSVDTALQRIVEQGPLFAALILFIAWAMVGKIRFGREVVEKDTLITRLTDVVAKNSETTGLSVQSSKEAIDALKQAVVALHEAEQSFERITRELDAETRKRR